MTKMGCDVVVVGGELCGLVTAAILCQHPGSPRVVVIDDQDPGLGLPLGDRLAPAAPSLFRLAGPPPNGERLSAPPQLQSPVVRLLDELGIKLDARRVLGDPVGIGLFDDPDIRMVVPVDADARVRELTRVFGADDGARAAARILELHGDTRVPLIAEAASLHHKGLFAAFKQRRRVQALGPRGQLDVADDASSALADLPLGVAAAQLAPFVQARAGASPSGMAGLLAGMQLQCGAYAGARGGLGPRAALAEVLLEVIRRHRGEVVRARVTGVDASGKSITTLHVTGANSWAPRLVVDATPCRDLTPRLPDGRARKKLLEAEQRVQLSGDAAAVRWLIPGTALPRGMPPMGLVLRTPTETCSAVLVGIYAGAPLPDAAKGGAASDGALVVVAGAVCSAGKAAEAATEVEAALDHLLPFARGQALARDVLVGGAAQAPLPQWTVVDSEHPLLGRRPQTPFANLLRAGRDLVPGLGVDGELVGARAVAARAEAMLDLNRKAASV